MNAQPKTKPQEWGDSPAPTPVPAVYSAIAKVTAALAKHGISKDRKNEKQGYKFRGIDDVYNALSEHLSATGLCILPRVMRREVTERASKSGGVLFYVVLDMQFDLVCASDGSSHTIAVSGEAMDSGDKATNKAMSAAYKYACMQTFCIPTEGDNDADAKTHEVAPKPVNEDAWTSLNDAAKEGEPALREAWKQISEETRNTITAMHTARWEKIKAIAMAKRAAA